MCVCVCVEIKRFTCIYNPFMSPLCYDSYPKESTKDPALRSVSNIRYIFEDYCASIFHEIRNLNRISSDTYLVRRILSTPTRTLFASFDQIPSSVFELEFAGAWTFFEQFGQSKVE